MMTRLPNAGTHSEIEDGSGIMANGRQSGIAGTVRHPSMRS